MKKLTIAIAVVLLAGLAGCSTAPDYEEKKTLDYHYVQFHDGEYDENVTLDGDVRIYIDRHMICRGKNGVLHNDATPDDPEALLRHAEAISDGDYDKADSEPIECEQDKEYSHEILRKIGYYSDEQVNNHDHDRTSESAATTATANASA